MRRSKVAMKSRGAAKSNAGHKAKSLRMAKLLDRANPKPRKAAPKVPRKVAKAKFVKAKLAKANARRAANAMHTRSHTHSEGGFPDIPVRLWRGHGLRIEEPRFGFHEGRYHCAAFSDGNELKYVAVSLEESTREGAGRGLILKEDIVGGTDLCEYGGEVVSQAEAKM